MDEFSKIILSILKQSIAQKIREDGKEVVSEKLGIEFDEGAFDEEEQVFKANQDAEQRGDELAAFETFADTLEDINGIRPNRIDVSYKEEEEG